MSGKTLYEKIWDRHMVRQESKDLPGVLYIDLHLVHEVTSPQAFQVLRDRKLTVRRPDKTHATMDHSTPSLPPDENGQYPYVDQQAAAQVKQLEHNCAEFGVPLHALGSKSQGIVHVIGPELGLTLPGKTVVCGDSHTATHGAFGALAFGIGTSEVGHVLATQCLLQRQSKTMAVNVSGKLQPGVDAKDLILAIIEKIGVNGGTGHVIEYRGEAITALSMEQRMTVCNMSIEAGARAGLMAPDQTTFDYLKGREHAPEGADWDAAVADWQSLHSDADAAFHAQVHLDASTIQPMITYGTNPEMAIPIDAAIPSAGQDESRAKALAYMGFEGGQRLTGQKVDVVFIGSCTNSRIEDLRNAARVMRGRKIAQGTRVLVVPGSGSVKQAAESEGLDRVFLDAGAEWRQPACSMCIAMNGDHLSPGQLAVSTSNRNFEGRQGSGGRTLLASPATAAAAAVTGVVTDARQFMEAAHASV